MYLIPFNRTLLLSLWLDRPFNTFKFGANSFEYSFDVYA